MAISAWAMLIDNTERVSGMIDWSEACVDDPAIDMAAHLMVFGEEGLAAPPHVAKRPVAGAAARPPSRSALRRGGHLRTFASTRVTKSTSLRRRRSSPQRNERNVDIACRDAVRGDLSSSGSATRQALALPWFVPFIQRARPWRAPRPAASSRPSSARGLVVASSIGSGARPSH